MTLIGDHSMHDEDFLAPRRCMREPVPEILHAAHLLDRAVGAHLTGDRALAEDLIRQADMPSIRTWTESLWGNGAVNPDQPRYTRLREIADAPPWLPKTQRVQRRMPGAAESVEIIGRSGWNCAFCGLPVIRTQVREAIRRIYPAALPWGSSNQSQHSAFQCMWLQFDHVLPHSRGGGNSVENVVVTCAPCNYGRGDRTLEEVGLIDPRLLPVVRTSWDGLERFAGAAEGSASNTSSSRDTSSFRPI